MSKPEMILWLSDARGIYIPRDFAGSFADRAKQVIGVTDEDWAILEAGPDHELYWDAWTDIEQNAIIHDGELTYSIHNDGDCWLVPSGMEWDEDKETFVWPDEVEAEAEAEHEEHNKEQPK